MDTNTRTRTVTQMVTRTDIRAGAWSDAVGSGPGSAAVEAVPLPLPLPFDDGADDVIPFVLTAAAHREVLGRDVPPLVVVAQVAAAPDGRMGPEAGTSADPETVTETEAEAEAVPASDTRRAQARALLRSGMPVATIAAALDVASADVERWTHDLGDELARRRRGVAARRRAASAVTVQPGPLLLPSRSIGDEGRLLPGLAYAIAEVDDSGVALVHDDVEAVAVLLGALRARLDLPAGRIRVAVRLAPDVPADRTRESLAERLGVEAPSIIVGRASADASRGLELRVDVRDANAAHLVHAWREGRQLDLAVGSA